MSCSLTPAFCIFYCYKVKGGLTSSGDYPSRRQRALCSLGEGRRELVRISKGSSNCRKTYYGA